jgi:amino acid permease
LEDRREERKLMVTEAVGKVFGIIMVVLYFILGTTFIFFRPEQIPAKYATPFGILLFLYGLYRAYKYYKKYWSRDEGFE